MDHSHPHPRLHRGNAQSGYSLLETVMTITILGIVLVVAAPTASRAIAHMRVDRTARVVAADLELAFSLASRQRRPVRVTINSVAREYSITDRATGTVFRKRAVGHDPDLNVASITSSASSLDIFPNGLAAGALTVTLESSGHTRRVVVTRAGRVRITP